MPDNIQVVAPKNASNVSRLTGCINRTQEINVTQCQQLHNLLAQYFHNVTTTQFEQDLAEKEWVVLLTDSATGQIQGFSTLMRLEAIVDNQSIVAFFSGDTIIHRNYWGETELPRLWGRHVFDLAATILNKKVYWFLISSGYKTYRFLPVFFREFYPTYRCPTPPPVKKIIDALAELKFPLEYDSHRGIIRLSQATPLQSNVAEITKRRLKDPHVAYFLQANPGHIQGDELACLTEITPGNLTRAGRRMLGQA